MAGHELCGFLDGFSVYNQIKMAPEDRDKASFITEWGVFASNVMGFGLKNDLSRVIFKGYLKHFFPPL